MPITGAPAETAAPVAAAPAAPADAAGRASDRASAAVAVAPDDVFSAAEGVFGKGAEGLADLIEDILKDRGEPTAYITGKEASGAFVLGARYGSGTLHHQIEGDRPVYWTGPSVGFDFGADAAKVFVLVYNLNDSQEIFKRYPAGEGQCLCRRRLHRRLSAARRRGADPGPDGRRPAARGQCRLYALQRKEPLAAILIRRLT